MQWCARNNMSLNPRKCKEILVCFWKNNPNFPPMIVDEQPIEVVKSAKLLGLIFKDDLKWNDHVAYIVKKSAKRLYMLRLLKRARCDTKTLISVYFSCVRPILEYCAQVWHYNIPEYLSKEIERIQIHRHHTKNPCQISISQHCILGANCYVQIFLEKRFFRKLVLFSN